MAQCSAASVRASSACAASSSNGAGARVCRAANSGIASTSSTRSTRRRVSTTALGRSGHDSHQSDGERRRNGFNATMPKGMGGSGFFDVEDSGAASPAPSSSSSPFSFFAKSASSSMMLQSPVAALAPLFMLADAGILEGLASDIKPSYFASLGLFMLSAPGLWSLVKRSTKSKVDRKTFETAGPSASGTSALPLDELAREISMYFKRNNYVIKDAGEVITFEGNIAPERGTAAYITFCVVIGLLCIALVCSIALPGGNLWYAMVLVSPASGAYYMENAGRKEIMKVKMVTADDDLTTDVVVEGDPEEIERLRRDLNLVEKGKVYVKGILEQ